MSDHADQPPSSGNRWEPSGEAAEPGPQAEPRPPAEPGAEPTPPAAYTAHDPAAAVPPSRPTWLTRARAGVAGGAAAVLLAGGLGGFALGRATAGDGNDGRVGQNGVPTGFDRGGDGRGSGGGQGLPDGGPGAPQLGQPPGGGQVPDMPGPDDGRQEDGTDGSNT